MQWLTEMDMKIGKQHGFTPPGFAPAYANVTVMLTEGTDHEHDDRIVLSVRSAAKEDGSTGGQATIEMTRLEFIKFMDGARETLQP